jgi:hypothetical protein
MLRIFRICSALFLVSTAGYAACTVATTGVRFAAGGGTTTIDTPECTTVTESLSWLTATISAQRVTITAQSNNAASTRYGKVRVGTKDIFVTQFGTSAPTAVASVVGSPRQVPNVGNPTPFRVAHHLSDLLISISPLVLPSNATATIIATSDGYFANDVVAAGSTFPAAYPAGIMTVDGSSQTFTAVLSERNELRWVNVPIGALQMTATGTLRLRFPDLRATGTKVAFDIETTAPFALSNADVLLTAAVVQSPGITFTKGQPVFFSDPLAGQGYSITVNVSETTPTAFRAATADVPGTRFNITGNLQGFGYTTYARVVSSPGNAQLISANNRGGGGSYVTPGNKTFNGIKYEENDDGITYQIKTANDSVNESFSFDIIVQGGDQSDAQSVRDALFFRLSPLLLFGKDPCGTIPLGKPGTQRAACGSQAAEIDLQITNVAIVGGNRQITYTVTNTAGDEGPSAPVTVRGNAGLGYAFSACTRDGGACDTVSGDKQEEDISNLPPGTSTTFVVTIAQTGTVPDGTLVENLFVAESGIDEEVDRSNNQATDAFIKQACAPLSPINPSHGAAGGTNIGNVTVPNCFIWTASSNTSWLTVTSPAAGVENFEPGAVTYSVQPYTGSTTRTGSLTIAGAIYNVTQRPACSFVFTPTSRSVGKTAGATSFTLDTGQGCAWTITDNASWLTVSPASGTNSQVVTVNFTATDVLTTRTGTLTVRETNLAGGPFDTATVTQAAGDPCALSLGSSTTIVPPGGGTGTLNVTATGAGCSWSLSESATWLTLSSTSGTTSAAVTYTAAANTGAARTVTVNLLKTGVATPVDSVTLTQAVNQGSCVTLSSITNPVPATGRTGNLTLTATGAGCTWTTSTSASWIQVSPASGTGSASLPYRISPNFGSGTRTGTISIGGRTVSVTQSALGESVERRFVRLLYFSYLGRTASSSEVDAWIATGASRALLAKSFLRAPEFDLGGRFVAGLYVGLLNRDPEYSGWIFQRDEIISGTSQQCKFATNFVNSAEFLARNPSLSNEDFIRLLYRQILGREAASSEVALQLPALAGSGRGQMACNFLNTPEFRQGTDARLTAFLLYATLLLRDSSDQERTNLKNVLATNPSSLDSLLNIFANSAEITILLQ